MSDVENKETFGLDKAIQVMKNGGHIGKVSIPSLNFCKKGENTVCHYPANGLTMPFAFADTMVWDEDYYQVDTPDA